MQIDGVCFKHGENSETGTFRKKPKIKMVYIYLQVINGEIYTFT